MSSGLPSLAVEDYPNDYYNDYPQDYDYDDADDSQNSKETIVQRNPKFTSQSKKVTINEGDTIRLPCTVDNLDSLVIIWKKGDSIISVGENFMNLNDKRLVRSYQNIGPPVLSITNISNCNWNFLRNGQSCVLKLYFWLINYNSKKVFLQYDYIIPLLS